MTWNGNPSTAGSSDGCGHVAAAGSLDWGVRAGTATTGARRVGVLACVCVWRCHGL